MKSLQLLRERLLTECPVGTTNQRFLEILVHEKLTPMPLAAAVVGSQFQVVPILRQQRVGGPAGVGTATRLGVLPRFDHDANL